MKTIVCPKWSDEFRLEWAPRAVAGIFGTQTAHAADIQAVADGAISSAVIDRGEQMGGLTLETSAARAVTDRVEFWIFARTERAGEDSFVHDVPGSLVTRTGNQGSQPGIGLAIAG